MPVGDEAQPKAKAQPKAQAQPKAKAQPVKVDTKTKPTRPKHSTEIDLSVDEGYWKKQTVGYLRDQLNLRGFKQHKWPDGSNLKTADYLKEMLSRL